jgi:Holliday junction resolvase RusA-like endonuclease
MKFIVEGKPTGKGRPRLGRYGTYTPQKTVNYENLVKFSYLQVTNDKLVDCPIKIKIKAYFEPPKSISKKKYKELMGQPYTKKPDADNICKSILDGLNGIAYTDDNQVAELEIQKLYSDRARTEVEINKIGE